ncbi:MAG: hypothetical protein AUJ37_05160 [Candidatus Magasanikbacteria bacterium CG1_02_41_34]|uniref:DUF5667 domain-containing protein n=1 Tax=Candidatus Magasanikbacteria bacterium CG_4_10_14_0_2_um_filter_41_31 TaxID=1974639 RepID=A0A2M7V2I3_9BACT|nr:MAG: hypothetical protein AUJ37_05160 [Candidatus Magasanikbacteria bacterium CG1_02_41_34]PIZ92639.1 MAG: hypothetical protein COX83_03835 [Candidatus Magasanikbacteria bacterium CG_4_10_14_0_2_um_filter_41_31]
MNHFKKQFKHIRLSDKEAADMRADMISFVQEHLASVRKSDAIRHNIHTGKHFPQFLVLTHTRMFAGIILAIVAAFSGGTVFAAQGALPGDVLYPVKVHINEEVQGALALGTESKAAWETTLAERRSNEASTLATSGKLNDQLATDISAQLTKHLDKAESLMAQLEAKGNLEAAANAQSRLEALLKVQQRVFQTLQTQATAQVATTTSTTSTDPGVVNTSTSRGEGEQEADTQRDSEDEHMELGPISAILNALDHKAEVQARVRADYADKLGEQDDDRQSKTVEQTKQVTETKIANTQSALATFSNTSSTQQLAAQTALDVAVATKQEADTKLLAGEYGDAFELYHKAQVMLDRVKLLLRVTSNTDLNMHFDTEEDDIPRVFNTSTSSTVNMNREVEDHENDNADNRRSEGQKDDNKKEEQKDEEHVEVKAQVRTEDSISTSKDTLEEDTESDSEANIEADL